MTIQDAMVCIAIIIAGLTGFGGGYLLRMAEDRQSAGGGDRSGKDALPSGCGECFFCRKDPEEEPPVYKCFYSGEGILSTRVDAEAKGRPSWCPLPVTKYMLKNAGTRRQESGTQSGEQDRSLREKGKWVEDGYYGLPCVCSYCGEEGSRIWKFCPFCGNDKKKIPVKSGEAADSAVRTDSVEKHDEERDMDGSCPDPYAEPGLYRYTGSGYEYVPSGNVESAEEVPAVSGKRKMQAESKDARKGTDGGRSI